MRADCESDEVQIQTRWIFTSTQRCSDLIGATVDFYNPDYRSECQWWQGLTTVPHRVARSYVTECFDMGSNTIKYRAKLCCQGAVTETRCFSCNNVAMEKNMQGNKYTTDACNFQYNPVETCSDGEVCQTLVKFGTISSPEATVSKSCSAKTACEELAGKNARFCTNGPEPNCTFCCEGPFCNFKPPVPTLIPTSSNNACSVNPCRNGGRCVLRPNSRRGYVCRCQPGTWGHVCRGNKCNRRPCKNGGYCQRKTKSPFYTCSCKVGYTGSTCTRVKIRCSDTKYCMNGGTCYNHGIYGRKCKCMDGFIGSRCEDEKYPGCKSLDRVKTMKEQVSRAGTSCTNLAATIGLLVTNKGIMKKCRQHMGGNFQQGIDGDVTAVTATYLNSCSEGDRFTWYKTSICCPGKFTTIGCYANPCENGGWCFEGTADYVCLCRFGYEGRHCEHRVAVCYVSGDPHFHTYDGEMIHFQGECKYNMASVQDGNAGNLPKFSVLTRHERRDGNTVVSYTRYVEVFVFGHVIRLDRGKRVYVDGMEVMPDKIYPGFEITTNGRFVRLATNFSLVVESDGEWISLVKIPLAYSSKMEGICGDSNFNRMNDLRLANGTDVRSHPQSDNLVGNSWQVPDPEDTECTPDENPPTPTCVEPMKSLVNTSAYCGLLLGTNNVFEACIAGEPALAVSYFGICQYDVCANQGNLEVAKKAACGSLNAFASECLARGYGSVHWRPIANCPATCPTGMEYLFKTSACLATCERPNGPEECNLPQVENCVCTDSDQVVINGQCVNAELCGCFDSNGNQFAIGEIWYSDDCTVKYTCVVCTECRRHVGKIITETSECGDGFVCIIQNNAGTALCLDTLTCSPGFEYKLSGPGCNATCENPDAPETCPIQNVQACVCGDGLVLVNGVCVPSMTCGCTDQHGNHHDIGETWAVGCSTYSCELCPTCTRGVPRLVETVTDCQDGYECVVAGNAVTCEKIIQPCDDLPCQNGGTCTNQANGYQCECADGFTGVNCETVIHACDDNPCLNGGSCNKVGAEYTCSCPSGFTGVHCESVYRPCDDMPCMNGGSCTNMGTSGFVCACAQGFTGTTCESVIQPCDTAPCKNGATCTNVGTTGYTCTCAEGFTGVTCESVITSCDSNPCVNGICSVTATGYECSCSSGYTGVNCESVINYCSGQPCQNGGTCRNVAAGYVCSCPDDFTGDMCETGVFPCDAQPCQNGGSCQNLGSGFTCSCPNGFSGSVCETELTPCSSFPCKNGGTCQVLPNSAGYGCTCPDGYAGENCDQAECNLDNCVSNFDAAAACKYCDLTSNIVGYLADPCNCGKYYQCQWLPDGWHAIRRPCPPCLYWSQQTLTCSIRISMSCAVAINVTVSSLLCLSVSDTVSSCPLKAMSSDITKYRHNGAERTCPSRTLFSDYACGCIIGPNPGPVSSRTPLTCVSFDKGWNGFQTTNWVYMQFQRVLRVRAGKVGYAAYFNGGAHIEIPSFTYSYSRMKKMSISFWVKCTSRFEELQGLVTNGDCVSDPSLRIASKNGTIQASLTTTSGRVSVVDVTAVENEWHHVAYVWNGYRVLLYVDNQVYDLGSATGRIINKKCALVIGHTNDGKFFRGYLDEFCIYKTALTPGDVSALYNV
ncbi:hypothetical protein LSAT2_029593 [Lamellibrachia satsuma]|nr:hypothetical protein LSAT2_029593 [Lamellibrachia satsuma]